jgi:membrane-associated PAP2 superfamily phosphatase
MDSLTRTHASSSRFWWAHAWLPAIFFVLAAATIYATDLDRLLAEAWFFNAGTQSWVGAETWWGTKA